MKMDWNDPKHLLAAVAVVVVVIVGLYYLMSPYQNCMRNWTGDAHARAAWCKLYGGSW
mgnify:CR=1 FL=1